MDKKTKLAIDLGQTIYNNTINSQADEITRLTQQRDNLITMIEKLIDVTPSSITACHGYKCREPWCISCQEESVAETNLQGVFNVCGEALALIKEVKG